MPIKFKQPILHAIWVVGLAFVMNTWAAATGDNVLPTYEYKLDNGLKLIVREDHRAPTVVTQVWYRVGGSFEPNGLTGISHALEHMMFRGTRRYPKDAFSRLIAINGGDQNAFTANDFTAYYQELEANRLKLCFELEADRMNNLALNEEDFLQEIKVVMEERRLRVEDNPEALARERLLAAAHVSNPYHHPVIGWMSDIQNLKIEDLRLWYKMWYAPNNATVIVVGDVKAEEVFKFAKTYFGPLKPIEIPELKPRKESPPLGKKRLQLLLNATVPRLFISYNVPSIKTATEAIEPYALLVLVMALDGGNSSRFSKELTREQSLAAGIYTTYNPFSLHETLVTFSGMPIGNHTLEELEAGFLKQVAKLQAEPISEQELKRIKTNAIADHIYARDSMSDQAFDLGALESIGLSWRVAESYIEQIQAVTANDVQKVAQKYLTPERQTVLELIPKAGIQPHE